MKERTSVSREKMMCEPPTSNVNPASVLERQSPPILSRSSKTVTSSPCSRSRRASVIPVRPPPSTADFTFLLFNVKAIYG